MLIPQMELRLVSASDLELSYPSQTVFYYGRRGSLQTKSCNGFVLSFTALNNKFKIWVRDSILPAATMLIPQVELRSKPLHLTLLLNLLIKDWEIFKIPPQQWHALSSLDVATNNSTTKWFASSKLTNFNPRQCSTGRDDAYPTKWNWDQSLCIWLKLKTYHLKTLESRRSELSWTNFDHH